MVVRRLAVAGVAGLLLLVGLAIFTNVLGDSRHASAVQPTKGVGFDPLTSTEKAAARSLAGTAAQRSATGQGRQYLYAERHEEGKNVDLRTAPRRADVYVYDYTKNQAERRVVNLETNKVEKVEAAKGIQPPLARDEVRAAVALVLADPKLGPGVKRSFKEVAGKDLTSVEQLRFQGLIFRAGQAIAATNRADVKDCGTNRCLYAFIQLPNDQWIDTSRVVVDLTTRRVHVLNW